MTPPKPNPTSLIPGGSYVPIPDPTVLTTQQLQREIAASRDLVEVRIEGIREVFETRLEAMDKTVQLFAPEASDMFRELHGERFASIEKQFIGWDVRISEATAASQKAIDASLQAAEKAVGKMESAFIKQFDQIIMLMTTQQKGFDDKIENEKSGRQSLENRVQAIESQKKGGGDILMAVSIFVGLLLSAGLIIATLLLMPHKP